jgi:hypothetical protein
MTKYAVVLLALLAVIVIGACFTMKKKKKETWFSRNRNYGKANSIIWDRTLKKGVKGVAKEDADIRNTYKYAGTGDFTGMMCRKPNNIGCTTYNNIAYYK